MKVKLIAHTPDPDKVVSMAAKLCYSPIGVEAMSEKITSEEVEKFLGALLYYNQDMICQIFLRISENHVLILKNTDFLL